MLQSIKGGVLMREAALSVKPPHLIPAASSLSGDVVYRWNTTVPRSVAQILYMRTCVSPHLHTHQADVQISQRLTQYLGSASSSRT